MKTDINIPTNQSEITLGQYLKVKKLAEDETDEMIINIHMTSILCNITPTQVRGLSKEDFDMILQTLIKCLNSKTIWNQRFFIDKVEYGFLPNIDDMTLGEYVDIDAYIKDDDMVGLMSVLYRPIKADSFGRYIIDDYTGDEDKEIMNRCPLDAFNGAMVFFYHLGKELLIAIPHYLAEQMKKDLALKTTLENAGDGINQYTELLKDSLKILKQQLN